VSDRWPAARAAAFLVPGCNAPHKIVEFVLPAASVLRLQSSGAIGPAVKVTVSRSPDGAN
jgi:hypothetical protein